MGGGSGQGEGWEGEVKMKEGGWGEEKHDEEWLSGTSYRPLLIGSFKLRCPKSILKIIPPPPQNPNL